MSFMLLMLCARGHTWDFFYFLKYQSVRNGWEFRVHISFSLCLIRFNITDITDPVCLIMTRYKPSPASVQQALLKAIIMWLIIQVFCESLITEHLLTAQLHKGRPWVSGAQVISVRRLVWSCKMTWTWRCFNITDTSFFWTVYISKHFNLQTEP